MSKTADLKTALIPKTSAQARELLAHRRGEPAQEEMNFEEAGLDSEKPTPEEINRTPN